jgi:Ca-activated chloride channel family protein
MTLPFSFTALYPYALALAGLSIAGVIYAYLAYGKGQRVPVASLLLLKALSEKAHAAKKISFPLRALAELLLLLLLTTAALGIVRPPVERKVVLVVDNSLSTFAHLRGRGAETTLFDAIQDEAVSTVSTLGRGVEVVLYVTSPQLQRLSPEGASTGEVSRLIEQIKPVWSVDNLQGALRQVVHSHSDHDAVVITDKRVSLAPQESIAYVKTISVTGSMEPPQNIALSSLNEDRSSNGERSLSATVTSYAATPVTVTLRIGAMSGDGELAVKRFSLPAGGAERITIPLKGEPPTALYGVIDVQRTGTAPSRDEINELREDDVRFLVVGKGGAPFHVISPLSVSELAVSKIPSYTFQTELTPSAPQIIHRAAFDAIPEGDALIIAPASNSQAIGVRERTAATISITDTATDHPLLRYINLTGTTLSQARILEPLSWTSVIISSTEGPLALAGEIDGKRIVIFGFDLFPYEGKDAPTLSILLLNTLQWISSHANALEHGSPYSALPQATTWRVMEYPQQLLRSHQSSTAEILNNAATAPGVLESDRGELIAVNSSLEQESNYLSPEVIALPERRSEIGASHTRSMTHDLTVISALFFLLYALGWITKAKRRSRVRL